LNIAQQELENKRAVARKKTVPMTKANEITIQKKQATRLKKMSFQRVRRFFLNIAQTDFSSVVFSSKLTTE